MARFQFSQELDDQAVRDRRVEMPTAERDPAMRRPSVFETEVVCVLKATVRKPAEAGQRRVQRCNDFAMQFRQTELIIRRYSVGPGRFVWMLCANKWRPAEI